MGQRILRVEDDRFLRGEGLYVENQEVSGALHATFVRSPVAHARIAGIDTSAVESVPGAQVFTAADVDLDQLCLSPQCGFSSTVEGNALTEDEQWAKLRLVVEVAQEVWG